MKDYRIVFLDLDDTLLAFGPAEDQAMAQTFKAFGLALDPGMVQAYEAINRELWARLERGEIGTAFLKVERFRRLLAQGHPDIDPVAFSDTFSSWLGRGIFPLPGAVELCASLSPRCRLVVVSNGIKEVQVPRVRDSPLSPYIEALIVSEEAGVGKPDPGIFEHACRLLDFHDKAAMLMVGDSLASDIQGGANFGIDTCWYNPGHRDRSAGPVPTYEADSLAAIAGLLEGIGPGRE